MKEKIEQRVIGLFVLMLAILGYIAWSSMKTPVEAKMSSDWVNKTHATITDVNAVLSSLHAGDSALRTYLLTGDPRDQGAYRSAYAEMVEHLQVAKSETESGDEKALLHSQILEMETLISNRIDFTRSVALARAKGGDAGLAQARQILIDHPDIEPMGKLQRLVKDINDSENSLLTQRDRDAHERNIATRNTIYTGVVVNFVLLILTIWLMRDDLAARKEAHNALENANAMLEAKVQERTAELVQTNKVLKQENLERKWSSQALDHQLRYSQLIINSIYELVFVISRALNISRINPAVTHNTNWEPQDLVTQSLDRVLKPSGAEAAAGDESQHPIVFAMRQGREIQDKEALLVSKSGKTATVRYSMVPLHDQDKIVGAVVTVRMQNGAPAKA